MHSLGVSYGGSAPSSMNPVSVRTTLIAPSEGDVPIDVPTQRYATQFVAIYFHGNPCKQATSAFLVATHNPKVAGSNPAPAI
jgi:hypothetical protein